VARKRRTTIPITLYLPPADLAALRLLRARSGVPVAAFIRRAVGAALLSARRKGGRS
jgi:hypothetical protein